MPIPFLNSITLNKNEIQEFKVYNLTPDPTLTSAGDYGYMWLNTSDSPKTLKWWDGTSIRSIVDSGNTSTLTVGTANDLSGGVAGSLPYQQGVGDTTFLGIGTADQVLTVNSGATAPQWTAQSSLSVGSSTNIVGGSLGAIAVQTGVSSTNFLNVGTAGQVITSNGVSPQYVNQSTLSVGSATTAGSVTNALTAGTYLTSGGTFDGSVARTFAVDATDANTASKVVARDGSGNFAAGTITATRVTGLSAPSAGSDAANRDYVDGVAQGLDVKASCLVATTADITLASPGAVTIDGIYSATDFTAGTTRILVKDQSAPAENGIYIWQGPSSAMTRSADADTWDELVGAFTFVERGTANADSGWVCTVNAGGTLGSTAVTWVKFSQAGSYTAGNGIVQSGTSFNFAQSSAYTAGRIPFASSTTAIGFSSNLFWDNSNNRLGIGTATPANAIHVQGLGQATASVSSSGDGSALSLIDTGFNDNNGGLILLGAYVENGLLPQVGIKSLLTNGGGNGRGDLAILTRTNTADSTLTEKLRISNNGVCTWSNVGGVAGTAMTLNGTGLGIGDSPSAKLHVKGTGVNVVSIVDSSATGYSGLTFKGTGTQNYSLGLGGPSETAFSVANKFYLYDGLAGAMRLVIDSSGNVGIGTTTPATKFDVALAGSGTPRLRFTSASDDPILEAQRWSGVASDYLGTRLIQTGAFYFQTAPAAAVGSQTFTTRMVLDSSGNLGLGVTPKSWNGNYRAIQIGLAGAIFNDNFNEDLNVSSNAYYDSTDNRYEFIRTGYAQRYTQTNGGQHRWYTSTSAGNADTAITFTQAMTLDASGRLLLGTVSVPDTGLSFYNSNGTVGLGHYLTSTVAYIGTWTNHAFALASNGTERLRIKATGQLNFTGLASDPAGAAGDVVYNSTSNRLKYHNGTAWVNTGTNKYSGALAGSGTSFTVTHNLGTRDVTVAVRKSGSTYDQVFTDVQMTTDNTVTIVFASSVTGSDYTVTVIG